MEAVSMRPRVLLADDYPEMVKAVSRLLAIDCEVVGIVDDGSELLEAAARLAPDVIVLDLHLPTLNGLEACRQVTEQNPLMKVIMFTAEADPDAGETFLAAGASAYVSKLACMDLLSTIKRLCPTRC
jgi:CheY-like chemotaxis protein